MAKTKQVRKLFTEQDLVAEIGDKAVADMVSYARSVVNKKRDEKNIRSLRGKVETLMAKLSSNHSALLELPLGYLAKVHWVNTTDTVILPEDADVLRNITINGQAITASYSQIKEAYEALRGVVTSEGAMVSTSPRIVIESNVAQYGASQKALAAEAPVTVLFDEDEAVDVP